MPTLRVQVLIKASGHKTEVFVKRLPSVMYVRVFYCGKSSELNNVSLLHESLLVMLKHFKRETLENTPSTHFYLLCKHFFLSLFLRVSYTHLATREFSTSMVPNHLATGLVLQIIKILVGNADNEC